MDNEFCTLIRLILVSYTITLVLLFFHYSQYSFILFKLNFCTMKGNHNKKYKQLYELFEQLPFMTDEGLTSEKKMEQLYLIADDLRLSNQDINVLEQMLRDDNFAHAMGIYYETKRLALSGDENAKIVYEDLKPYFHLALLELVSKQ